MSTHCTGDKNGKNFSRNIRKFSRDYKYLVLTDLTNYFDNIGLRELRHIISSRIHAHEVILDLLFNLIERKRLLKYTSVPSEFPAALG